MTRESGECAISFHKHVDFTLQTGMFTKPESCLTACVFIPPNNPPERARSGRVYRSSIPGKLKKPFLSDIPTSNNLAVTWAKGVRTPDTEPLQAIRWFDSFPLSIVTYASYLFCFRGASHFSFIERQKLHRLHGKVSRGTRLRPVLSADLDP
jgi:hypothetical protein